MFAIVQAAGWPIYPLILCSVVGLALIMERLWSLRLHKIVPKTLVEEAVGVCRPTLPSYEMRRQIERNSPLGEVLAKGLSALDVYQRPTPEGLHQAMESAGKTVVLRLERSLHVLATIATIAPLLGLLGTVVGLIDIFGLQSSASMAAGPQPAQIAHGISVALYNTAFGLIVAIPALVAWRHFKAQVDAIALALEHQSELFYAQIKVHCAHAA